MSQTSPSELARYALNALTTLRDVTEAAIIGSDRTTIEEKIVFAYRILATNQALLEQSIKYLSQHLDQPAPADEITLH